MESCRQETLLFHEIEAAIAAKNKQTVLRIFTIFKEKRRVISSIQFRIGSRETLGISKQLLGIPSGGRY
jgi:hypothetical protein